MSNHRIIKTSFRSDPYIQELQPDEKLLYIYLITNDFVELCGIYEVTARTIMFETALSHQAIEKILLKFQTDGKIGRYKNWICVVNFIKNQALNPNMQKGIVRTLENLPQDVKDQFGIDTDKAFETLSKGSPLYFTIPNSTEPNLTRPIGSATNSSSTTSKNNNEEEKETTPLPPSFEDQVKAQAEGKYDEDMVKAFINYRTEPNAKGKQRRQFEKVFAIPNRLANRHSRQKTSKPFYQKAKPSNGQYGDKNYSLDGVPQDQVFTFDELTGANK